MSVYVYRIKRVHLPELGKAEAHWLRNHLEYDDFAGSATLVHVMSDDIKERLVSARGCKGCEYFNGGDTEADMKEHRRITKAMTRILPRLLDEEKARDKSNSGWVDLDISW